MLVLEKKNECMDEDVVLTVDLPILFATQGWQFSNIPMNDPKFVEPQQCFDTVCSRLSDVDKSIVWSTDGGSYAKNPRIYFIKDVLNRDRAYLCNVFLSAVDSFILSNFDVEVDMGFYLGKYCSESTKCAIQKVKDGFILSHYVTCVPEEVDSDPQTLVFTYKVTKSMVVSDISVHGGCFDVEEVKSLQGELTSTLQRVMRPLIVLWDVYEAKFNVSSSYLEIVRCTTEFFDGSSQVRQVGISYLDPQELCKSYAAVSTICEETGFKMDAEGMEGSTAICFTL